MRKISSVAMFRVSDEDQSAPLFGLPTNVLRNFDGGGARLTCMHICSSALFLPSDLDAILQPDPPFNISSFPPFSHLPRHDTLEPPTPFSMPTFDVKCTLPPPGTTFVRPPDVRGTLDIFYSCLTIIVLCTWAVMPLNVPTQYKSMPGRQTHMRTLRRLLNKLSWLAFNILGPEWPFVKAFNSRYNTKRLERKFDIYKGVDDVVWTRSHTQLANMGGFVIVFGPGAQRSAGQAEVEELAHPEACIGHSCKRTDLSDSRYIQHTDECARWRPRGPYTPVVVVWS